MNRIKELRSKNGWRQEDLAQRLHTRQQTVGNYETGYRSLDVETIFKLCDIFGVTSDYLLGRSEIQTMNFTPDELALINAYRRLSAEGQDKVVVYTSDLVDNPKYRKGGLAEESSAS